MRATRINRRRLKQLAIAAATACLVAEGASYAGPVPIEDALITVSYPTADGATASFSGSRNFSGSGPTDATVLGGAPNIRTFNSAGDSLGVFGRRAASVLLSNPLHAHVILPGESLITHAFFKTDNGGAYFPDLTEDGSVTISVANIKFAEPVHVVLDSLMLHVKWNDQADALTSPYFQVDDHHTYAETFRDFDDFRQAGLFANFPTPNYVLGNQLIGWTIAGDGTDTLSIQAVIPYDVFRNLEETDPGQAVPPGLPAPQGFLEPFHFHIEYLVVPEPATLMLVGAGGLILIRQRRTRNST